MRSPDHVMRLARLGAMHFSRLSFSRTLVRTARTQRWPFERALWDFDASGYGSAVYTVGIGGRSYSLVAFSHYLAPEMRTDRVIAEAWDTTYVLYDGVPDAAEMQRLKATVPRQEASRFSEREFILARANRSERLFEIIVDALAAGEQPDQETVREIGYLLRTSAVYGNGKFGIADREVVAARAGLEGPFVAEMLTVWLIRQFSVDLAEHCARTLAPATAVRLSPHLRCNIGVGNSTGLGMAPFLVRHPALLHRWISARETALARVRASAEFGTGIRERLAGAIECARQATSSWLSVDPIQAERISHLQEDLSVLATWLPEATNPEALYQRCEDALSLEGQEYLVSLLIDVHGELVDDLSETMAVDEAPCARLDGTMSCGALLDAIWSRYGWATGTDFQAPDATARFWYTSEEKLEPRLGWRGDDEGEALELPLGFGRDVYELAMTLRTLPHDMPTAEIALRHPHMRHALRRVQIALDHPYGEIRDNVLDARLRPIDLMRCKLSFLGSAFYDPRSDLSLRVRFFQGAPHPDEILEDGGVDGEW